jgi:hypothetical protein
MTEKKVDVDTKAAVQALEYLLTAGYVSKRRLYLANFMRGLFFWIRISSRGNGFNWCYDLDTFIF